MTCPTCRIHAGLLTAEEYEDTKGECLSGDATLLSRDMMIERSRASVKESEARNGASASENSGGRGRLHAVNSDRLVHGQAQAVSAEARIASDEAALRISLLAVAVRDDPSARELLVEAATNIQIVRRDLGQPPFEWGKAMQACMRLQHHAQLPIPATIFEFRQAAE